MLDQLLDTAKGTGIPNHIIDAITGALHDTVTPALIVAAVTHNTTSSHRSSLTHSRDCSRSRSHTSYKPSKNTLFKSSSSSSRTSVKPQDKKHRRVTIDDPQSYYYSSDDTSSDSEDDLN